LERRGVTMPSNDASKRGITQFLGEIIDFS
jgi:hypothetical protein